MGATNFYERIKAKKPSDAFKIAREEACWECGHGGYTGTIAEKHGFTMSRKPKEFDAEEWVGLVEGFDEEDKSQEHFYELKKDSRIYEDKWGDALCIPLKDEYIFIGFASC